MWMNEHEIAQALRTYADDPIIGPAVATLANLAIATNEVSDGWHMWPKPKRAAAKLMDLIQRAEREQREGWTSYEHTVTAAEVRAALTPIKSLRTRTPVLVFSILEPQS